MQVVQAPAADGYPLSRRSTNASGRALFALGLALLTGLTLGQLTLLGGSSFEQPSGRSTEATRTGLEFYDAIATYLATGQTSEFGRLVQPDFVDHLDGQPATNGLGALLRQLKTLRAFVSGARLTATPMSRSVDLVRFAVSIPPGADATILGLPVTHTEVSTFSEILRIADGRIAERWSDLQLPAAFTSIASVAWDSQGAGKTAQTIEQVVMLRGSTMTLQMGTGHVILVESGALTITATPHGAASRLPEFTSDSKELTDAMPVVALPGSAVVAAGGSSYRIVNDGPAVASALLIRIAGYARSPDLPELGEIDTSQNDIGVQIETLSAAISLPKHKGVWTIEIGRATLAPGTSIPAHEVPGSELIVVEQGALDADLEDCEQRCIQTIKNAGAFATEQTPVRAAQGISASNGATSAYRVAGSGPATLLIVTVAPAM